MLLINLFIWMLFGMIVGWIAEYVTTNDKDGLLQNIGFGVLGAILTGVIFRTIGVANNTEFSLVGLLFAVTGAILVVALANKYGLTSNSNGGN